MLRFLLPFKKDSFDKKSMKKYSILFLLGFINCFVGNAQLVSTLGSAPSNGDVAVDAQGNIYVSSEGNSIFKFDSSGVLNTSPFAIGNNFSRASGLCFDNSGDTLYVTNRPLNGQGWVTKVAPNGSSSIHASNLYFPGDISFDGSGNYYVTQFNNVIKKVLPNGNSSNYVSSPLFNTPIGIVWTPGDTLFVSSAHDGNIYMVLPTSPSPTVQWFAHVNGLIQNWACGFMTYKNGDLLITNGDNKIHQIDKNGNVSTYAGTGSRGAVNGPASLAQFSEPNGIGVNRNETKVYVAEYNKYRIRLIQQSTTAIDEQSIISSALTSFPNPFSEEIHLELNLQKAGIVNMQLFDVNGRKLMSIQENNLNKGMNRLTLVDQRISQLKKGAYFMYLEVGNESFKLKLIKQ